MMRKNIEKCPKCKKPMMKFRMVLMMGPKGYRRYAVCPSCSGGSESKSTGGRQMAAKKQQPAEEPTTTVRTDCSQGYDMMEGGKS
jgi:hypothetical protein